MRFTNTLLTAVAVLFSTTTAVAIPEADVAPYQPAYHHERDSLFQDLWKRRGGGSSGGRGGSGSSSSGSSSSGSSSSGSSSSGSSSGSSSSSSGSRGSTSSSTGGRTTTGSGVAPAYGGGRYYGGGSTVPYRSGGRSTGGISPLPFVFAGAAIAFWPGVWYHPAYMYPYANPWNYHNSSSNQNETKPVLCGCAEYQECGCDDNSNSTYINDVIGNGSLAGMNQSLATVGNVNGTDTILINGTLPNGTTASGGTDSANAGAGLRNLVQQVGWWPVIATGAAMVFFC